MDENKLITIVKPYLDNCRAGDWNHALRVVKWVKVLGEGRDDLGLLITAAYIHDIGWSNILPKGKVDFQEMLKYEEKANENTQRLVKEVLGKMEFNEEDINTVIRLIKAADKHDSEKDDEVIIVDADSLSKLCVEHVEEKYTPESYQEVISLWEREFPKRFKTEKGKSLYPELLENLKKNLL
ncbi:MAG: HD domain-containing protein [Candidatus Pacearchaeota archaeon]|nr:MAG: HD domain-containing protein [Candidatus Pacearchaeota archaeon]